MKMLRLLVWLRWKLFLRSTTPGSRLGGALLTLLLLAMLAPAWFAGALAAHAAVKRQGAAALPLIYGVCQLAWVAYGLLSGALGRAFDLDKFLRYPVRPRTIFATNVLASLLAPAPVMILPALVAVVIAAAERAGVAGALGAAAGGVALLLITAALLQVLLALADELLRRDSARFLATALVTLLFVGVQFALRLELRHVLSDVSTRLTRHEITPEQALAAVNALLLRIPTVAAPAALARGALNEAPLVVLAGLVGSLALLALAVLPGAWLMRRTARGSAGGGPVAAPGRRRGIGSFALAPGLFPRGIGLILRHELLTTLRNPQRLMALFVTPLVGLVFFLNDRHDTSGGVTFVIWMLGVSVGSAGQLMFAYDGPGVRSYFLLPFRAYDVILAKHLELLLRLSVQFVMVFGLISVLGKGLSWPLVSTALVGVLALVLLTIAFGTDTWLRHPVRARRRGLGGRGGSGWESALMSLGAALGGGLLGGIVWLARRAAGPTWRDAAGLALVTLVLALAVALWRRSLGASARLFMAERENLVAVLARSEDD